MRDNMGLSRGHEWSDKKSGVQIAPREGRKMLRHCSAKDGREVNGVALQIYCRTGNECHRRSGLCTGTDEVETLLHYHVRQV